MSKQLTEHQNFIDKILSKEFSGEDGANAMFDNLMRNQVATKELPELRTEIGKNLLNHIFTPEEQASDISEAKDPEQVTPKHAQHMIDIHKEAMSSTPKSHTKSFHDGDRQIRGNSSSYVRHTTNTFDEKHLRMGKQRVEKVLGKQLNWKETGRKHEDISGSNGGVKLNTVTHTADHNGHQYKVHYRETGLGDHSTGIHHKRITSNKANENQTFDNDELTESHTGAPDNDFHDKFLKKHGGVKTAMGSVRIHHNEHDKNHGENAKRQVESVIGKKLDWQTSKNDKNRHRALVSGDSSDNHSTVDVRYEKGNPKFGRDHITYVQKDHWRKFN